MIYPCIIYAYVHIHVVHTYMHVGYDGVEVMGSEGYLINQVTFSKVKALLNACGKELYSCIADL